MCRLFDENLQFFALLGFFTVFWILSLIKFRHWSASIIFLLKNRDYVGAFEVWVLGDPVPEVLRMWSDAWFSSRANMLVDRFPIFTEKSYCLDESLVLILGPRSSCVEHLFFESLCLLLSFPFPLPFFRSKGRIADRFYFFWRCQSRRSFCGKRFWNNFLV